MKRFLLLVIVAALTAMALWYGLRGRWQKTSTAAVAALLPRDTLLLAHLPDFNRARADWHKTDLYQLWREPALQDFLQKPLARIPSRGAAGQKLQEFEALGMQDAFAAVTSWENNEVRFAGGFRFKGSEEEAEKIVGQWRAGLLEDSPEARRETVAYQQRSIQTVTQEGRMLATVYANQWFFAANNLASLQAILDRADGRNKDSSTTLAAAESFAAASRHLPANYATMFYARLDRYLGRLIDSAPKEATLPASQAELLRKVKGLSGAMAFDDGKIRDALFVEMPKVAEMGDLTRSSLALGTKETFLYAAAFLHLPRARGWPDPQAAGGAIVPGFLHRFVAAFAANGITLEEWHAAFGPEIGLVGDWPAGRPLPALFATLPVKDPARANKIIVAMTAAGGETATWTQAEKEGVRYFSMQSVGQVFALAPTVGLSNQMLLVGADAASVEAGMKRGVAGTSELAATKVFQIAQSSLPPAKQAFAYVDSALLYHRLDATLRPMLLMGAAFMPGIAENVDLSRIPTADVITKHLSPIVISQYYQKDGYVTESLGPVSIYQGVLGVAALRGVGAVYGQIQAAAFGGSSSPGPAAVSSPALQPSPTGSATP